MSESSGTALRFAPWLIALAACGVAAWSQMKLARVTAHPEDMPHEHAVAAVAPATAIEMPAPPVPEPLRATRACLAQLERTQGALLRATAEGAKTDDGSDAAPACLSDPEVEAAIEKRIDEAVEARQDSEEALEADTRELERSAFDAWADEALGLSADESHWLESYVCTSRELRQRTLASLEDTDPAQALGQLKEQRSQILKDIEDALGTERYTSLRAVGGIALVADTTNCP